jgi:acyl carrier protein
MSKWPVAIVYMEDLPKNRWIYFCFRKYPKILIVIHSAGKPLRIKLSKRLDIGVLTDAISTARRHFEAEVPHPLAPLTESITCSRVSIHLHDIENALKSLSGIDDFALRVQQNGAPEAFISVSKESGLASSEIRKKISRVLPGYSVPDPLHVFSRPLARTPAGGVDFNLMEKDTILTVSSTMSQNELLVRDIVADLLLVDSVNITRDSDFFLLGGNSLLLGRLSHYIRKQCGTSVGITSLYSSSTIHGIAATIEEVTMAQSSFQITPYNEKCKDSAASSETALDHGYEEDFMGYDQVISRGQTHPLNLIVQALPIFLFYPLKAALTCEFDLTTIIYFEFTIFLQGPYSCLLWQISRVTLAIAIGNGWSS